MLFRFPARDLLERNFREQWKRVESSPRSLLGSGLGSILNLDFFCSKENEQSIKRCEVLLKLPRGFDTIFFPPPLAQILFLASDASTGVFSSLRWGEFRAIDTVETSIIRRLIGTSP
jgi:hypothetical protein